MENNSGRRWKLVPLLLSALTTSPVQAQADQNVQANRVTEIRLQSTKAYDHPFVDLELDAIVTRPDGQELRVPMFWAGEQEWRLRYASHQLGKHSWRTECSDRDNACLLYTSDAADE